MIDFGFGAELVPIDCGDLEWMRKNRNRREIFKWCRQSTVISEEGQKRWHQSQDLDSKIKMFKVVVNCENPGMESIGVCGLTDIDRLNQRAEFSLWIDPDKQKKGYGSKALMTLFRHGFEDLNLNLIWGETFQGNPALKLFNNLGMRTDGVRRQFYFKEGRFIDAYLVSVTRQEWKCLTSFQSSLEASSCQVY